ncbi:F-box domain [Arabidopsis thaliana x Arabidopsis arenosa]|uniref:F-box domain n=1 Tax=Arabidopsis thaliana x Arabidopsis arenosa TaxID=1240361 RepID=A0A8T1ZMY9_9BRAS|nr:F-box domain [Arabidopsis thaliana x Arabidopsis arenosa]
MKLCYRQLCVFRKKNLAKKGNRRRFKLVPTRKKSILGPNPTPNYIPLDLQIETLLRLPVKSLLRFQCLSKLWSSIITSQDFRNRQLNLAASSAPSRLLITFGDFLGKEILLFSLPYPNVSSSSPPSCLVRYKDLSLFKVHGRKVYNAVRGLICVGSKRKVGICNPSTRRLHVLPQIKHKDPPINLDVDPRCNYFLGYDLVGDQYKILAVDNSRWSLEQKVVVLGGERVWRKAPCAKCPHVSRTPALYMDGTLYYGAYRRGMDNISIIVSFDVRLEKFKCIKIPVIYEDMWDTYKTLMNYGGKISVLEYPREGSFRMWVVEDAEKEEWSMTTFHLPQSAACLDYDIIGTFNTGDICLLPKQFFDPFCLVYYNLKTNSTRNVMIEGLNQELYGPKLKSSSRYNVNVSAHFESFMLLET